MNNISPEIHLLGSRPVTTKSHFTLNIFARLWLVCLSGIATRSAQLRAFKSGWLVQSIICVAGFQTVHGVYTRGDKSLLIYFSCLT